MYLNRILRRADHVTNCLDALRVYNKIGTSSLPWDEQVIRNGWNLEEMMAAFSESVTELYQAREVSTVRRNSGRFMATY